MGRSARLVVVLLSNVGLVVGLLLVGLSAHSLGMLAEGVDYLADAAAIGVSLLAVWLTNRPPTRRHPDGHPQAAAFAALVNAGWLFVLCVLVGAAAVVRLVDGTHRVHGLPVLVVSGIAAVVMLAGALILGGDDDDGGDGDLAMRAVLLDTAADAAAAAGVAVSGAVISITGGLYWLDPTIALTIAAVVAVHSARLLKEVVRALRSRPTRHGRPTTTQHGETSTGGRDG